MSSGVSSIQVLISATRQYASLTRTSSNNAEELYMVRPVVFDFRMPILIRLIADMSHRANCDITLSFRIDSHCQISIRQAPMSSMVAASRSVRRDRARSHGFPSSDPQLEEGEPSSRHGSSARAGEETVRQKRRKTANTEQPALPSMLSSLFPYNEGPEIGVEMISSAEPLGKLTRTNVQENRHRLRGDPLLKRKSLNVRGMFREQLRVNPVKRRREKSSGSSQSSINTANQTPATIQNSVDSSKKPLSRQIQNSNFSSAWIDRENRSSKYFQLYTSKDRGPLSNLDDRSYQ